MYTDQQLLCPAMAIEFAEIYGGEAKAKACWALAYQELGTNSTPDSSFGLKPERYLHLHFPTINGGVSQ